jgi:hypothetical protein
MPHVTNPAAPASEGWWTTLLMRPRPQPPGMAVALPQVASIAISAPLSESATPWRTPSSCAPTDPTQHPAQRQTDPVPASAPPRPCRVGPDTRSRTASRLVRPGAGAELAQPWRATATQHLSGADPRRSCRLKSAGGLPTHVYVNKYDAYLENMKASTRFDKSSAFIHCVWLRHSSKIQILYRLI